MATEKTVISIEVEGTGKAINSLKELKAELKAAQSAALNGDGKAAKRVAELKDKMDDLKDTTKSLQGSGVEKIGSGFNLLGQGFKDMDLDKIKTGFKGLGSAMAAIPIFLIIEGITYLIQNFDELSKGTGILATMLRSVGDVISWLVDGFTDLIGVTDESTRSIEAQGEAISTNAEKSKEALNATTAAYDRQIAVAKVSGKSTIQLEQAKQQAIIDTNLAVAKQIEAFVRAGGVLDDEKRKLLSASLESIKNAKVQEYVITETDKNARKALKEKEKEEFLAIEGNYNQRLTIQKLAEAEIVGQELMGIDEKYNQLNFEANQAWNEKERQERLKNAAEAEELTRTGLQAAQNLSDIFFINKMNKVKKGSEEEEKIARKQFNINKAFSLGMAAIDGAAAITKSLSVAPPVIGAAPNPAGIAALVAIGISTAATIAKIASTQFQGSAGGGGSTAINMGGSAPQSNGTPQTTNPQTQPQTTSTTFTNYKNDQFVTKAFVVESDIRHSSQRVDTLKEQATW